MRSLLNCATREELLKRQKCSPEDKKMKVGKKGLRADTRTESRVICVIIEVTQGDYLGSVSYWEEVHIWPSQRGLQSVWKARC
jgi:hypothetical protein